ncbi:hypothetical protein NDU88_003838 [Pleurodeles waltl]|uniref:Uncharacterized protein n=1 Tax=Pleurodeles waltl TaxID=8319 RepID=A0AAV7MS93_PLEWA|nr:hypothetical protein NDU88_003838 [Pleurodeles waltl]
MLLGPAGERSNTRRPRGPRICAPSSAPPKPRGKRSPLAGAGGRGIGRSTPPPVVVAPERAGGGAPFTAGLREARLSVAGRSVTRGRGLCSCRRPRVRAPLSPQCVRGERLYFSPGVGPPSPPTLRMCSNIARGAPVRPRRRHPRPTTRRLTELSS